MWLWERDSEWGKERQGRWWQLLGLQQLSSVANDEATRRCRVRLWSRESGMPALAWSYTHLDNAVRSTPAQIDKSLSGNARMSVNCRHSDVFVPSHTRVNVNTVHWSLILRMFDVSISWNFSTFHHVWVWHINNSLLCRFTFFFPPILPVLWRIVSLAYGMKRIERGWDKRESMVVGRSNRYLCRWKHARRHIEKTELTRYAAWSFSRVANRLL